MYSSHKFCANNRNLRVENRKDPLQRETVSALFSNFENFLCFQRYYIVGSNNTRTRYRILKIDRTEGHDLTVVDDRVEYTEKDMINCLNLGLHRNASLSKIASAFGIVGKYIMIWQNRHVVIEMKYLGTVFFLFVLRICKIARRILHYFNNKASPCRCYWS